MRWSTKLLCIEIVVFEGECMLHMFYLSWLMKSNYWLCKIEKISRKSFNVLEQVNNVESMQFVCNIIFEKAQLTWLISTIFEELLSGS